MRGGKTFAARVLDEQYVVEQRHQPFANGFAHGLARIVAGKASATLRVA